MKLMHVKISKTHTGITIINKIIKNNNKSHTFGFLLSGSPLQLIQADERNCQVFPSL